MKKVLFFVAAMFCSMTLFAQGAHWIGKSYLVVGESWFNVSNSDDEGTAKLPETLGNIAELKVGGQIQSWGDDNGEANPAYLRLRFDESDDWQIIELKWFKYADNNNFFGVGGDEEQGQPKYDVVSIEAFDELSEAEHVLEFYFVKPSTDTESAPDGMLYDSNGGANYKVKFTKGEPTGIDHIVGNAATLKVIENGVLYIYRNGVKFDAQGKAVR